MGTPGPLGSATSPGCIDRGTLSLGLNRAPGVLCVSMPSKAEVEQAMQRALHKLAQSTNWIDTRSAAGVLLGEKTFSAGVAAGMLKNLVESVAGLADLLKTFVLADYHDAHHDPSFWQQVQHQVLTSMPLFGPIYSSFSSVGSYIPEVERMAKQAHDEREVLIQTVCAVFDKPGDFFDKVVDSQKKRFDEFMQYKARHTLSGEFHAGMLFGELLLDVLLIIDGVTAVAKLAAKVPGLLKMLPRLRELAGPLRSALRKLGTSSEAAGGSTQGKGAARGLEPKGRGRAEAPDLNAEREIARNRVGANGKTRYADLSPGAKRLVDKLDPALDLEPGEFNHALQRVKVGSGVRLEDLRQASEFNGREIAVVRDVDGQLIAIQGTEDGILKGHMKPGDEFLIHTHPVYESQRGDFTTDIRNATDRTEAVVDWGGNVTYFNRAGVIENPTAEQIAEVMNNLGFVGGR